MSHSNNKKLQCLLTFVLCAVVSLAANATGYRQVVYYHTDALQSPVAASDENGNVIWRESYKPYGERLLKQSEETNSAGSPIESAWDEKLWFTGKQEEYALNLQNFGARWYDQETGRFLSIDPVDPLGAIEGNPASFNRYIYANNNPYLYVDPDGREAIVILQGNRVNIQLPIAFSGPGATPDVVAKFKGSIEQHWSGKFGRFDVETRVLDTEAYGVINHIFVPTGNGKAFVDGVGGTTGEWPADRPGWTAAHEGGHLMGLDDKYDKSSGLPQKGWENNIMGRRDMKPDHRNIIEIKNSDKNKVIEK